MNDNSTRAYEYLKVEKYDSALFSFEKAIKENDSLSVDDYIKAAICAVRTKADSRAYQLLHKAADNGLICYEIIRDVPEFEKLKESDEWKKLRDIVNRNRFLKENKLFENSVALIKNNINESKRLSADKLLSLPPNALYDTLKYSIKYVQVPRAGISYLFYVDLPWLKRLPFKVYVPKGYNIKKKYPAVLFLHGASNYFFHSMVADNFLWQDNLFKKLCDMNEFLIIQPICDRDKEINWALNAKTYDYLERSIAYTKMMFNVDDNKVFVYGHSDGGRGAFCMTALKPAILAGAVSFNMGPNLIFDNIFIKNTINRPLYIVHSDLDDINPIQDTQNAVAVLKKNGANIKFKVFKGYKHEDRHLEIEFDNTVSFLHTIKREPFKKNVYWQTSSENTGCDWVKITSLSSEGTPASWSKPLNFKMYNKEQGGYFDQFLYDEKPYSAVEASFSNNTFTIRSSMVKGIEILISKDMVDLSRDVKIVLNGKLVFNDIVSIDKRYMISNFKKFRDRSAIWVNRIKLNI